MRHLTLLALLLGFSATGAAAEPLTVASFLDTAPKPGRYEVIAFVVGSFECPPCPEGSLCEPCPPDALYIADKPTPAPLTFDRLTDAELVLGTEKPTTFRFGSRYRFTFELTKTKSSGRKVNDIILIDAKAP